jgi:hypothetical protein
MFFDLLWFLKTTSGDDLSCFIESSKSKKSIFVGWSEAHFPFLLMARQTVGTWALRHVGWWRSSAIPLRRRGNGEPDEGDRRTRFFLQAPMSGWAEIRWETVPFPARLQEGVPLRRPSRGVPAPPMRLRASGVGDVGPTCIGAELLVLVRRGTRGGLGGRNTFPGRKAARWLLRYVAWRGESRVRSGPSVCGQPSTNGLVWLYVTVVLSTVVCHSC